MAERLHARGSARRRRQRLRQIGNPTLIAQQRREGAGGGRAGRRGAGRGGQPGRPKLRSAPWRRGEAEKQVAGRSEPELPGEGGCRRGPASAPGSPSGHCGRGEPCCGSRPRGPAAPQPARQLATSPGLRGARGRGAGAATNRREAPAPPPPAARLQTCSVGQQPQFPRLPARGAPTRDGGEVPRGLGLPQAQAPLPSLGSAEFWQPANEEKPRGDLWARRGDITCHPRISKRSFRGRCGCRAPPLGEPGGRR